MGVQGLLPMLKSVLDHVHVRKYRGKTVGIDAAGWLYKGAYCCARELVLADGREAPDAIDTYLNFSLQQIALLREHDITPVFVFDGAPLPAKAALNAERYRTRQMWKQRAFQAIDDGDDHAATTAFNKAVSVSNEMIMRLIQTLRRMEIQFYVAPYEADAQLAFLSRIKLIDAVISEDSDCIPYGAKTILFKWNPDGWTSELKRRSLGANEDLSFIGWSEEMFIMFCILCGCDYCPSVPGVGIVTAYKIVNINQRPNEVINAVVAQKRDVLPQDYIELFVSAILTYRHHLVFDPREQRMKMLNPLSVSKELMEMVAQDLSFLGNVELNNAIVTAIANGQIHPVTHENYEWNKTASLLLKAPHDTLTDRSLTTSETTSFRAQEDCVESSTPRVSSIFSTRNAIQERPKPPSTSWRHLDSVLGSSPHILNFTSPKVSENFRSLVSSEPKKQLVFRAGRTAEQLKQLEERPVREMTKRVRKPKKRRCDDQRSGFDGEVTCRVDVNDPTIRAQRKRRLGLDISDSQRSWRGASVTSLYVNARKDAQGYERYQDDAFRFTDHKETHRECSVRSSVYDKAHRDAAVNESDAVRSGDENSEVLWYPQSQPKKAPLNASCAEEKWDRILGTDVDGSDDEDPNSNAVIRVGNITMPSAATAREVRPRTSQIFDTRGY